MIHKKKILTDKKNKGEEKIINFINKKKNRNIHKDEKVKKEINSNNIEYDKKSIKNFNNKNNIIEINKSNINPNNIQYLKNLRNDLYSHFYEIEQYYNSFIIFKSINDILYLIYAVGYSIYLYDLIDNVIICKLIKAHDKHIVIFRYCFDKINKRDLILSLSHRDCIKLWDINKLECLLKLQFDNIKTMILFNEYYYYSICFLIDNEQIYICTSIGKFNILTKLFNGKKIRIFDLNGKIKKEIGESENILYVYQNLEIGIFYMDYYYDNKTTKNYIITSNKGYVISYDYNENTIYRKYRDDKNDKIYKQFIIYDKKNIIELIVSSYDGNIRIWNFDSGELLNIIKVYKGKLFDICMWNDEYLFIGCDNGKINLIDIKEKKTIKKLNKDSIGLNFGVTTINKVIIPRYGECLITQSANQLSLWVNNI